MLTSAGEQSSVAKFVNFVRDRRVLYAPAKELNRHDARVSVKKITIECESSLSNFEKGSATAIAIERIAEACSYFLKVDLSSHADFYIAVGALRALCAEPIVMLSTISNQNPGSIFYAAIHSEDFRE